MPCGRSGWRPGKPRRGPPSRRSSPTRPTRSRSCASQRSRGETMKLRNLLFAMLSAACAAVSFAQTNGVELIPRATFFGNPTKTQGLVSPDGKWVSWIAPRDGVLNIWVAPADDPSKAKPLTDEKVRPIRQHFWARNSKVILFINDRGGDENFLLYGVSPEGGAMKSFTPFQKTRVVPIAASPKH